MADRMPSKSVDLIALLDEVRAIATEGLAFTAASPHNFERYTRLMAIASREYGRLAEVPSKTVDQLFRNDMGVVTPKVGVDGALIDGANRILLVRRADDGRWGMPGGWVSPGETPLKAVKREVREEVGLNVRVGDLVTYWSRAAHAPSSPHGSFHLLFECRVISGRVRLSHESTDAGYFDPWSRIRWHRDHRDKARAAVGRLTNTA